MDRFFVGPPSSTQAHLSKHINLTIISDSILDGRRMRGLPVENNGYLDSEVLSRQHAKMWEESSRVSMARYLSMWTDNELLFIKV